MRNRIHVIYRNRTWAIKRDGAKRASKLFPNMRAAVRYLLRKKTHPDIVVHYKDGSVDDWIYGNEVANK